MLAVKQHTQLYSFRQNVEKDYVAGVPLSHVHPTEPELWDLHQNVQSLDWFLVPDWFINSFLKNILRW